MRQRLVEITFTKLFEDRTHDSSIDEFPERAVLLWRKRPEHFAAVVHRPTVILLLRQSGLIPPVETPIAQVRVVPNREDWKLFRPRHPNSVLICR